MIRYERLNHCVDMGRLLGIVAEHTSELHGPDSNFDVQHMLTILNAGMGRVFVVRDGDEIVGYSVYVVSRDLFYAHIRQAECVAIFVRKVRRGTILAKRLAMFGENYLRDKDQVTRVIATTSNDKRFEAFYTRMGYEVVNVQVAKEL